MIKQELIHLHSLLCTIRESIEQREDVPIEVDQYAQLSVGPASVHKSKSDHEQAVMVLASGLSTAVAETGEGSTPDELVGAADLSQMPSRR